MRNETSHFNLFYCRRKEGFAAECSKVWELLAIGGWGRGGGRDALEDFLCCHPVVTTATLRVE